MVPFLPLLLRTIMTFNTVLVTFSSAEKIGYFLDYVCSDWTNRTEAPESVGHVIRHSQ